MPELFEVAAPLAMGIDGRIAEEVLRHMGKAMMVNDHLHSICSFDGEYSLTDLCRAALEAGIESLCLTDHCDLVDEYGDPYDLYSWEAVNAQLRAAHMGFPGLDIRKGVELGQAILRPEAAERILREPGIDFVLGSMHNAPGGGDYYYMEFTDKRQCEKLLEEYLCSLLELSKTDFFDSLAHLTYPVRYMRTRDGVQVDFHPLDDLVREIFKTLIARGKALELNTSGYKKNDGEPLPPAYMLRMYRRLGGELVTIGSDAHEPECVADGLERGMELLRSCGFRYLTVYRDRKPQQLLL